MTTSTASIYQVMPPLSAEERATLKASIREHGVLVPVEEDAHGNVIDGHHRVELWHELRSEGVKVPDYPRVIRVNLTEAEKLAHARRLNLERRHLSREQRNQLIDDQLRATPELSSNRIAESLGVTDKTVAKRRHHLESTSETPKLGRTVGRDGKSRPARRPTVFAKDGSEAKRAQKALDLAPADSLPGKILDVKRLERVTREYRTAHLEPVVNCAVLASIDADLRVGDLETALADVPSGTVQLILTEPPYVVDQRDCYSKLSRLAARLLRDEGMLLAYAGQYYLPRILNDLGTQLSYHWTFTILHSGPKGWVNARHIQAAWKPVVAFTKRGHTCRPVWTEDVIRGDGPEKSLHEWQQGEGEIATLIQRFTEPGEMVLDPFLGSGTTAAAAVKLGRRFIGCDINPAAVALTQERLSTLAAESMEAATA
jgi:site-specific DNA-methyltransferase (adenine-specific)